jgi:putative flippase GtrA
VGEPVSDSYEIAYRLRAAARRPASWLQLLKFGIVGGSGYMINLAVFAVLAGALGLHHVAAAIGAFCVAVANNFLWNRYWTFEPGDGHPAFQAARFFAVSVAALLVNLAVLEALLAGTSLGELAAQAIAVAVAMPLNFLGNKLWTFA